MSKQVTAEVDAALASAEGEALLSGRLARKDQRLVVFLQALLTSFPLFTMPSLHTALTSHPSSALESFPSFRKMSLKIKCTSFA